MVNVRPPGTADPRLPGEPDRSGRFNVLLAHDRTQTAQPWTDPLARMLQPHGVQAFVVNSGHEALATADEVHLHAAIIDLATPRDATTPPRLGDAVAQIPGGLWLLEVLTRRPTRTPVVVVDSRPVARRDVERAFNHALRLGAFTVVSRPRSPEAVLAAVQRVIDRRYRGRWPGAT